MKTHTLIIYSFSALSIISAMTYGCGMDSILFPPTTNNGGAGGQSLIGNGGNSGMNVASSSTNSSSSGMGGSIMPETSSITSSSNSSSAVSSSDSSSSSSTVSSSSTSASSSSVSSSSSTSSSSGPCIPTITCASLRQQTPRYCGNFVDDCGHVMPCDCDPKAYETTCGGYGWDNNGVYYPSGNQNKCGGGCGHEANPIPGLCSGVYPFQWWCAQANITPPPINSSCFIPDPVKYPLAWCCQ